MNRIPYGVFTGRRARSAARAAGGCDEIGFDYGYDDIAFARSETARSAAGWPIRMDRSTDPSPPKHAVPVVTDHRLPRRHPIAGLIKRHFQTGIVRPRTLAQAWAGGEL